MASHHPHLRFCQEQNSVCPAMWNGRWVGKHCLSPHPDLGGLWAALCLTAGLWGYAGSPCSDVGAASHPLPGGSFCEVSWSVFSLISWELLGPLGDRWVGASPCPLILQANLRRVAFNPAQHHPWAPDWRGETVTITGRPSSPPVLCAHLL